MVLAQVHSEIFSNFQKARLSKLGLLFNDDFAFRIVLGVFITIKTKFKLKVS